MVFQIQPKAIIRVSPGRLHGEELPCPHQTRRSVSARQSLNGVTVKDSRSPVGHVLEQSASTVQMPPSEGHLFIRETGRQLSPLSLSTFPSLLPSAAPSSQVYKIEGVLLFLKDSLNSVMISVSLTC